MIEIAKVINIEEKEWRNEYENNQNEIKNENENENEKVEHKNIKFKSVLKTLTVLILFILLGMKALCYSNLMSEYIKDPELLWKKMNKDRKEQTEKKKVNSRYIAKSKELCEIDKTFTAFHKNTEPRNDIEFKFKQMVKYSMFNEPPYSLERIKVEPNLAFKIKGLIYGQKYLTY